MDNSIDLYFDEIITELARVGRADLIQVLRSHFNYLTETEESSEDISEGEEEQIEIQEDKEGFLSLR